MDVSARGFYPSKLARPSGLHSRPFREGLLAGGPSSGRARQVILYIWVLWYLATGWAPSTRTVPDGDVWEGEARGQNSLAATGSVQLRGFPESAGGRGGRHGRIEKHPPLAGVTGGVFPGQPPGSLGVTAALPMMVSRASSSCSHTLLPVMTPFCL